MEIFATPSLRCDLDEGLARITLTQPDRGNPMDRAFVRDLRDLAIRLTADHRVRAILIAAEGRFFSVGGDITLMADDPERLPQLVLELTADLHAALLRLMEGDAPVVTVAQGAAAGGGLGLLALGDIVCATPEAKLSAAFASIGFSADSGCSVSLTARMGVARARRFLLMSETLSGEAAVAAGLVDHLVAAEALGDTALAIARRLAAGPTRAYGGIRAIMGAAGRLPPAAQLEHEARTLSGVAASADAREGLAAFRAKRRPDFTGK